MTAPSILFLSHAPSANTLRLSQSAAARIGEETSVTLNIRPPLEAGPEDVLAADGVLIGTTENIGYMAGATKDFFDRSYNDLLEIKAGLPVAVYIRAGLDGTGSRRAIEGILTGLRWRLVAPPLILHGAWQDSFVTATEELSLTLVAGIELGLF